MDSKEVDVGSGCEIRQKTSSLSGLQQKDQLFADLPQMMDAVFGGIVSSPPSLIFPVPDAVPIKSGNLRTRGAHCCFLLVGNRFLFERLPEANSCLLRP